MMCVGFCILDWGLVAAAIWVVDKVSRARPSHPVFGPPWRQS